MIAITGMRMSGKMSTGVRRAASGPMIRIVRASTTNVYGRRKAMRTSAIIRQALPVEAGAALIQTNRTAKKAAGSGPLRAAAHGSGHPELLLQAGRGGRVLEHEPLVRID